MNQPTQTSFLSYRRIAIKLHYSAISQFCYYWVNEDRPFDFKVQRSKQSPEYLGICLNVENVETVDFLRKLPELIRGVEIIDI